VHLKYKKTTLEVGKDTTFIRSRLSPQCHVWCAAHIFVMQL